jgi:hypothetical protein
MFFQQKRKEKPSFLKNFFIFNITLHQDEKDFTQK